MPFDLEVSTISGRIRVDHAKARVVFDVLLNALENREFPYNFARIPHSEENFPKGMKLGGVEEAVFLFVVCLWMRGGIKSIIAFKALSCIYEKRPEIYDPSYIASHKDPKILKREISNILREYGLKYRSGQKYAPREWIENLTKLYNFWQGDPRQLFYGNVTKLEDVYARMISLKNGNGGKFDPESPNGFLGFREKMVSMIAFFLADRDLLEQVTFPIPVDFHVMRVLVSCRIIKLPKDWVGHESEWRKLAQLARKLTQTYCDSRECDWKRLGDALWLLSSSICARHPGNISTVGRYRARETSIKPLEFNWTQTRAIRYVQSCGTCPVERFCELCVPSAYYYRQGKLVTRGKRTKPQNGLFS